MQIVHKERRITQHPEANVETKMKRRGKREMMMMMIKIVRIDQKLIFPFALFITRFVQGVFVCVISTH